LMVSATRPPGGWLTGGCGRRRPHLARAPGVAPAFQAGSATRSAATPARLIGDAARASVSLSPTRGSRLPRRPSSPGPRNARIPRRQCARRGEQPRGCIRRFEASRVGP
jgi:hypothetical protein